MPFNGFLQGRWTTTSWRNYHQTFLVETPGWKTCKFIPRFIYAKRGLNPNLPNIELMFYLQMIEKSFFSNVNVISNADVQYIWIQVSHVLTTAEQNVPPALLLPLNVYFRHKMTRPVKIWV